MLEKQHEPIAFQLAQSVKIQNQKILYLCDSDKEARLIKNKHNESLTGLIKSNVSEENQLELQEKISQKQRLICQLKLIRAEIYCNEMQLKIFFM